MAGKQGPDIPVSRLPRLSAWRVKDQGDKAMRGLYEEPGKLSLPFEEDYFPESSCFS